MKKHSALIIVLATWVSCAMAQTAIVTPLSFPAGNLSCTQLGDPEGRCRWSNWFFTDANGIQHSIPGATIQSGILHPDGTITNLHTSTLNAASSDGLYFLQATGPTGTLWLTNTAYPKIQVLNVTYAPPGPGSTVDYRTNKSTGVTTTVEKSFAYNLNLAVTLGVGGDSLGADYTHSSTTSTEESITKTDQYDIVTKGTGNFINHDYDVIDVWLNPEVKFTFTTPDSATWNTAVNPADPYIPPINGVPQMDHLPLLAGWLNGNIPWPANDWQYRLARAWDTSIPNPGLTTADFAAILALDPFAQQIDPISGARLPLATNAQIFANTMISSTNARYTLLRNINYSPVMQTISEQIGNVYSSSVTNSNTNTLSLSWGFKSPFVSGGSKWTWTDKASVKASTGNGDITTYTIVTPDSSKPLPYASSVDIYQDNIYGSFMFVFPGGGF